MLAAFTYAQVSLFHISLLDLVQPKNHIYSNLNISGFFFFSRIYLSFLVVMLFWLVFFTLTEVTPQHISFDKNTQNQHESVNTVDIFKLEYIFSL